MVCNSVISPNVFYLFLTCVGGTGYSLGFEGTLLIDIAVLFGIQTTPRQEFPQFDSFCFFWTWCGFVSCDASVMLPHSPLPGHPKESYIWERWWMNSQKITKKNAEGLSTESRGCHRVGYFHKTRFEVEDQPRSLCRIKGSQNTNSESAPNI